MEVVPKDAEESTEAVAGVHLSLLAGADEMNVQHFLIEPGAEVPEHDHENEQTGYITNGTLTFVVDGEEIDVSAGDSYAIPADEPHAAENRGDVPVEGVDVFSPPRENPDWKD
ncbi:cupin domain-containing protein [Halorussus caseinilyticus]|uniref:Cupin domain-containing protein n=1 Tax=Halorussus caseinilyticus TaxID=3034025 RepID=A0ABD5WRF9_9EURY|nr:cupin domain-containing protein [Halorussus sp. DT72]